MKLDHAALCAMHRAEPNESAAAAMLSYVLHRCTFPGCGCTVAKTSTMLARAEIRTALLAARSKAVRA